MKVTDANNNTVTSSAAAPVWASLTTPRLVNLSMLSNINGSLSMGFVIGGAGTSGNENLLIRAVGPSIGPGTVFNVGGVMPDPTLTVVQQTNNSTSGKNSGWGTPSSNVAPVQAADTATGAFPLTVTTSLDSALVASLPPVSGGYSATVAGASGDGGYALTEVYDDTANYVATSPRLVNLSCLTSIGATGTLDVGFVVNGTTSETLLVRVTGPALTLSPFSLTGTMPDPQLSVHPLNVAAYPTGFGRRQRRLGRQRPDHGGGLAGGRIRSDQCREQGLRGSRHRTARSALCGGSVQRERRQRHRLGGNLRSSLIGTSCRSPPPGKTGGGKRIDWRGSRAKACYT